MLSALLAIDLLTAFIAIPYMLGEGSVYWNDLKFIRIVGIFIGVVLFAMKILLFVLYLILCLFEKNYLLGIHSNHAQN